MKVIFKHPIEEAAFIEIANKRVTSRLQTIEMMKDSTVLKDCYKWASGKRGMGVFFRNLEDTASSYGMHPVDRLKERLAYWIECEQEEDRFAPIDDSCTEEDLRELSLLEEYREIQAALESKDHQQAFLLLMKISLQKFKPVPTALDVRSDEWEDVAYSEEVSDG